MAGGVLQTLELRGNEHDLKGELYESLVPTCIWGSIGPEDVARADRTCLCEFTLLIYISASLLGSLKYSCFVDPCM